MKHGDIKTYREKLNRDSAGQPNWKHTGNRGQRVRPYGDYLYAADREMFMVGLREWIAEGRPA